MKFVNASMENFRSYREKAQIRFSTDPNRPVTLVFGVNGGGKTSLLLGLYWCMYGDTDIEDDPVAVADLANDYAFEELAAGEKMTTTVEVELQHEGNNFRIVRTLEVLKGSNNDRTIATSRGEVYDSTALIHSFDTLEFLLPKDLARYFFYAQETLSNPHATANREELREALYTVVGRNRLTRVELEVEKARKKAVTAHNRAESASEEEDRLKIQVDAIETEIAEIDSQRSGILQEIQAAEEVKGTREEMLAASEDGQALIDERDTAKGHLEAARAQLHEREEDVTGLMSSVYKYGMREAAEKFVEHFRSRPERYPNKDLTNGLIEQAIVAAEENGDCPLCGAQLNHSHVGSLNEMRDRTSDAARARMSTLKAVADGIIAATDDDGEGDESPLKRALRLRARAAGLERKAHDAHQKAEAALGDEETPDPESIKAQIREVQQQISALQRRRHELFGSRSTQQSKLDQTNERLDEASLGTPAEVYRARKVVLEQARELAQKMRSEHLRLCRPALEREMNDHYLAFKSGRAIQVDDEWNVRVIDEVSGATKKTSGSETGLLTYAFAGATANLLPGFAKATLKVDPDNDVEPFPLVVDNPLEGLAEYQNLVVSKLPKFGQQLILISPVKDLDAWELMLANDHIGAGWIVKWTGPVKEDEDGNPIALSQTFRFGGLDHTYVVIDRDSKDHATLEQMKL